MNGEHARLAELGRFVVSLSLVLGATAGALRILDALPARLRHDEPGVRRVASVADAERVLGASVWMPAYFPDTLRWPATAVAVHAGPPPAVTVAFADGAGDVAVIIVESLATAAVIPPVLPPQGTMLQVRSITVNEAEATLSRFIGLDGRVWHDLAWSRDGRTLVLRSRGPVEDLLRMAGSIRPRAGREP